MKTSPLQRLALAAAAVVAAMGAPLLAPSVAVATLPNPYPPGITMGGLHLTPASGSGTDVPAFTADHPCRPGTNLANVNTIDLGNVEQTLSGNVVGEAAQVKGFGAPFSTDMNTVQLAAGTPGTAEQFLLMVDCRTGPAHGTYTDAAVVEFDAGGNWSVRSSPRSPDTTSSGGGRTTAVVAGIAVVVIGVGAGLWYVMRRRRTRSTA
ncbi:hypothetical protein [Dactylosporangium sp. CA-092794]|uniref:hypothetical protein n=1 Tax=Dactylosporangium sp. CA-092794 TaxID=3239929 RepID=UPI003D93E4EF